MRQNYEQERSTRQPVEWRLQNDVSSGSASFFAHLIQLLHRQSWYRSLSCSWQVIGSLVVTQASCIGDKGQGCWQLPAAGSVEQNEVSVPCK